MDPGREPGRSGGRVHSALVSLPAPRPGRDHQGHMKLETMFAMTVGLLAGPAPAQSPPSPSPAPDRPSLTGHWQFNVSQSDDARAKMREAFAQHGGGGGGGYGRGGYGGGG